jgi:hypothetical protein
MIKWRSFGERFLLGVTGLVAGFLLGPIVLLLIMTVYGSDFGLDNVRPGMLIGAVVGFGLGVISRQPWPGKEISRGDFKPISRLAAGLFCLALAMLGFSTGHIYNFPPGKGGGDRVVSWEENPGLFLFFLVVWILLGILLVGLAFWNFLDAGDHSHSSARGVGMLLRARRKWQALGEPIQIVIIVAAVLSPFLYFAVLGLLR